MTTKCPTLGGFTYSYTSLPFFLVMLSRNQKAPEFQLTALCYRAIKVHAYRSQSALTQCCSSQCTSSLLTACGVGRSPPILSAHSKITVRVPNLQQMWPNKLQMLQSCNPRITAQKEPTGEKPGFSRKKINLRMHCHWQPWLRSHTNRCLEFWKLTEQKKLYIQPKSWQTRCYIKTSLLN
jgi:hypothetical protein